MSYPETSTREKILQAALAMIAECQISSLRLRHVAQRAGVHYGNLHYYFRSRDDLFVALIDYLLFPIKSDARSLFANLSVHPLEKLDALFQRNLEFIRQGKELRLFFDFWVQSFGNALFREKIAAMYSSWRKDIGDIVLQGIQQEGWKPRTPEVLPTLVVGLIDGISTQYLVDPQGVDLEAYFHAAREIVLCELGLSEEPILKDSQNLPS